MADLLEVMKDLNRINSQLEKGDKRELARRMGKLPAKVYDAFHGFVRDVDFLTSLATESRKLIEEREAVPIPKK